MLPSRGSERLLAVVDQLCAESPVVLVAEDLQWADEASLLVWYRLSRSVGQLPLLLAGSSRPGAGQQDLARLQRGVAERGGTVVELGPLADGEVRELVGALAGGRPGQRLAGVWSRRGAIRCMPGRWWTRWCGSSGCGCRGVWRSCRGSRRRCGGMRCGCCDGLRYWGMSFQ